MPQNHLARAKKLATILDSKFKIGPLSFGFDPLLDIVPGLGSIVGAITSCYIFWIGSQYNVPGSLYLKMGANILIDFIFGAIPVVGIFIDMFYKANLKNIAVLENYLNPKDKNSFVEGEIIA